MTVLEKIRKRPVLLFTIIIVALLAFILGDFLTSGRSFMGPGDSVAKANGAKVDYQTYQERVTTASEQAKNNPQQGDVDSDVLSQQVINELLMEKFYENEYSKLGLEVTDDQLSKLFFDPSFSQYAFAQLMQPFGQNYQSIMQRGIVDVTTYADAMKNPAKYQLQPEDGQMLTQNWQNIEKNMENMLLATSYNRLLDGLFSANEVDAKAIYEARNTTNNFQYVSKDLATVDDKDVKLTDEDYKAYYDAHKGQFKLYEETRYISYITVPVAPSEADYKQGERDAENVFSALASTEGTSALKDYPAFIAQNGKVTRANMSASPALRELAADSVALVEGQVVRLGANPGSYSFVKINGVGSGIDRVKFSVVAAPAEADSLLAKLNVQNFDSIAPTLGGNAGLEMSLVNPQLTLSDPMKDALASNPVGQIYFLSDTIKGTDAEGKAVEQINKYAFLISERDAETAVYDIANVTYTVEPSKATINDLNTKFHAFVGNNSTAEAFTANAEKAGYTVEHAVVSASNPSINANKNSRGIVKWAMENKAGKVSPVFNKVADNYLMAVAVEEVYGSEYLPVDSKYVREALKDVVLAEKKAEKLINDYKGKAKDVAGYASVMGSPVSNGSTVFGDNMAPFGLNVQGAAAAAQKGKLVGPFRSGNAVYVISVTDSKTDGRPYNFQEEAVKFKQSVAGQVLGNPFQLLLGDNKIENNIIKFIGEEVN